MVEVYKRLVLFAPELTFAAGPLTRAVPSHNTTNISVFNKVSAIKKKLAQPENDENATKTEATLIMGHCSKDMIQKSILLLTADEPHPSSSDTDAVLQNVGVAVSPESPPLGVENNQQPSARRPVAADNTVDSISYVLFFV